MQGPRLNNARGIGPSNREAILPTAVTDSTYEPRIHGLGSRNTRESGGSAAGNALPA
jgi:hypothetical protein